VSGLHSKYSNDSYRRFLWIGYKIGPETLQKMVSEKRLLTFKKY